MSSRTAIILILALAVCAGLVYASGQIKLTVIGRQTEQALNECSEWETRLGELKKEIAEASSNQYVEKAARDKLGLVKPGETLYLVAEPDQSGFVPVQRRSNASPEIGD
ncbi:MAG: septum formation initiator family protein [Clostridia bacterium]|nr:septum formation initiator family protein [Clostridia bacterium]